MTEQKTFYVTKYALSTGIMAVSGEVSDTNPNMLCYTDDWKHTQYAKGEDWYDNLGDAIANCERRRRAEIASMKRKIAKLEKMEFNL